MIDKIVITEEHLRVLERISFRCIFDNWTGDEIIPAVDNKRPLGNEGTTYEVCRVLGYKSNEDGEFTEVQYLHALRVLAEIPTVLSVICKARTFQCGEYELSGIDYTCERSDLERAYARIAVNEPLNKCVHDPDCALVLDELKEDIRPFDGDPFHFLSFVQGVLPVLKGPTRDAWTKVVETFEPYRKQWTESGKTLAECAMEL